MTWLLHTAQFASLFALALWVGGGAAVGFVAAPAIFETAGSRHLAGNIVGKILQRFDAYALTLGPIALLGTVGELLLGRGTLMAALGAGLVAAMLVLLVSGRVGLTPRIHRLRLEMGEALDSLPDEDPRRQAFGRLHGISVLLLLGQLVLGAFAIGAEIVAVMGG